MSFIGSLPAKQLGGKENAQQLVMGLRFYSHFTLASGANSQTKPNTCATGGGACEAWAGTDSASSANKDETSFGCPPPAA